VRAYGEGTKRLHLPQGRSLELEYSAFGVDGRPDLTMVVFNPIAAADTALVRSLMARAAAGLDVQRTASSASVVETTASSAPPKAATA